MPENLRLRGVHLANGSARVSPSGRWLDYSVVVCVTWLLVGPRVSILGVAGSSIRLEDFVLMALWLFVAGNWRSTREVLPSRSVLPITLVSLFAVLVGVLSSRVELGPAILYSVRILEYWAVFPALFIVLRRSSSNMGSILVRLLACITLIQVGVGAAQSVFGITIGFSKFSMDRGAGLTAGPYELGAMCSMLALFWLSRRNFILATISCVGLLQSSSRISIIALIAGGLVLFLLSRKPSGEKRIKRKSPPIVVAVVGVLLAIFIASGSSSSGLGAPISERLESTSALTSWTLAGQVVSGISLPENSDEYAWVAYGAVRTLLSEANFVDAGGGETSDMIRFYRWHVLIDSMNSPITVLFGLGPSFAGPSVDGSYVRMAAETGLVGVIVWLLCIRRWALALSPSTKAILVALLVGAVFIDVLYSMKLMVLLWVLIAFDDARRAQSVPEPVAIENEPTYKGAL